MTGCTLIESKSKKCLYYNSVTHKTENIFFLSTHQFFFLMTHQIHVELKKIEISDHNT